MRWFHCWSHINSNHISHLMQNVWLKLHLEFIQHAFFFSQFFFFLYVVRNCFHCRPTSHSIYLWLSGYHWSQKCVHTHCLNGVPKSNEFSLWCWLVKMKKKILLMLRLCTFIVCEIADVHDANVQCHWQNIWLQFKWCGITVTDLNKKKTGRNTLTNTCNVSLFFLVPCWFISFSASIFFKFVCAYRAVAVTAW